MLTFKRLLFWYTIIMPDISLSSERVFELSIVVSLLLCRVWALSLHFDFQVSTVPLFSFHYISSVSILFRLSFHFQSSLEIFLLISHYHFAHGPSFGFRVNTVSITDDLSIFIFSIQLPLSLWKIHFLFWLVDIAVINYIYIIIVISVVLFP